MKRENKTKHKAITWTTFYRLEHKDQFGRWRAVSSSRYLIDAESDQAQAPLTGETRIVPFQYGSDGSYKELAAEKQQRKPIKLEVI